MKVIAFNGSARKNGNTAMLINYALRELEAEGIETELVQFAGKKISGCIACYKCMELKDGTCAVKNDPVNEWIDKMKAADAVILGSPVYFADLTAGIKGFIERAKAYDAHISQEKLKVMEKEILEAERRHVEHAKQ